MSLISNKVLELLSKDQLDWVNALDANDLADVLNNAYRETLITIKECNEKEALAKYGKAQSLINTLITLILNRDLIVKYYPDKIMVYHEDVLQFWFCNKQDAVFEIEQIVYDNNAKLIEQTYLTPLNNVLEEEFIFQQIQQFINNYKMDSSQPDSEVKINNNVLILEDITENKEIMNLITKSRRLHLKNTLNYLKKYTYHKIGQAMWRINCNDLIYFNLSFTINNEYVLTPEVNPSAIDTLKTAFNAIVRSRTIVPSPGLNYYCYHYNVKSAVRRLVKLI
jgi:hypothetical protein